MKPKRRIRQTPEVTCGRLLDATERLMVEEGYAAVTTRRVAAKVGLTAALVHYYYPTTEDLLLAAYRRAVARKEEAIRKVLESERPLHALWQLSTDESHMALGIEFMALANHRKAIRTEIARHDQQSRKEQAEVLSQVLAEAGVDKKTCPAVCAATLIDTLARALVQEDVLGISYGHLETKTFVERLLGELEKSRMPRPRSRTKAQTN